MTEIANPRHHWRDISMIKGTYLGAISVSQRVIVVEDDLLNRMLFTTWLEDRACVVDEFGDGRNVCETVRAVLPDLIVMDICLPDVSGVELIERLKSDPSLDNIPILAVTGYAAKEDETRIRSAGACAYLRKPVKQQDFNQAVDRLLATRPMAIAC